MTAEEIRALDESEVRTRIAELEEERFRLRFRSGTEALEDALRLRSVRRDIARLHTVARERLLGIKRDVVVKASATKSVAKKSSPKKSAAKKATKAGGR